MTPNTELRKYVYDLLDGHVMDGIRQVPVYSLPPSMTSFPFIHLDTISLVDESCKDNLAYRARLTLNIYDQHNEDLANWARSENIGSQTIGFLNQITGETDNWYIVIAKPESFDQQEQVTEAKRALITTIVMNYYVELKN